MGTWKVYLGCMNLQRILTEKTATVEVVKNIYTMMRKCFPYELGIYDAERALLIMQHNWTPVLTLYSRTNYIIIIRFF